MATKVRKAAQNDAYVAKYLSQCHTVHRAVLIGLTTRRQDVAIGQLGMSAGKSADLTGMQLPGGQDLAEPPHSTLVLEGMPSIPWTRSVAAPLITKSIA